MPRHPRIKLADMPLHILQRGIGRESCFYAEEDYECYLHWLWKSAAEYGCAVHAYVLMPDHVHLLLTPNHESASALLMQSIGRYYVQYINRYYRRTGTLWEGRYKSSVVQADAYLLTCMRYIELNPTRIGLVADPGQYPWSSYRSNALGIMNEYLTPHSLYQSIDPAAEKRAQQYRTLFKNGLNNETINEIRQAIQHNQPLGGERFVKQLCERTGIRPAQVTQGGVERRSTTRRKPAEQTDFGF